MQAQCNGDAHCIHAGQRTIGDDFELHAKHQGERGAMFQPACAAHAANRAGTLATLRRNPSRPKASTPDHKNFRGLAAGASCPNGRRRTFLGLLANPTPIQLALSGFGHVRSGACGRLPPARKYGGNCVLHDGLRATGRRQLDGVAVE